MIVCEYDPRMDTDLVLPGLIAGLVHHLNMILPMHALTSEIEVSTDIIDDEYQATLTMSIYGNSMEFSSTFMPTQKDAYDDLFNVVCTTVDNFKPIYNIMSVVESENNKQKEDSSSSKAD